MLLLIYQCRDIYIIWRSQRLAHHYLAYNNITHHFINFYENQKNVQQKMVKKLLLRPQNKPFTFYFFYAPNY